MTLVAQTTPTSWYRVGVMLEIETATLDTFETQAIDQVRLYIKVFNQWKQEQKVPYTWDTIISSLEAVNENETAAKIREWLNEKTES